MISKSYSFVNSLQDSLLQGLLTCLKPSRCSPALVGWAQRAQDREPRGSGRSFPARRGFGFGCVSAATFANAAGSETSSSSKHSDLGLGSLCFYLQLQLFLCLLCVFILKAVHLVPFSQMKLADTF